jgi:hypothetical protein
METLFIIFWAVMILGSITWYGFLIFYVGFKAGRDIRTMIATLKAGQARDDRR